MKPVAGLLLAAFVLAGFGQSPSSPSSALTALVETERAFARMSVARGRRAAFLAFFGDDALFFTPAPANAKRLVRRWAPAPYVLDWEPRFGDVAEAGDLGYTTGPYLRTSLDRDGKIVGSGWYFTLWKKQRDGTWKVAIDAGITTPSAAPLRQSPFEVPGNESAKAGQAPSSLLEEDRSLCTSIASKGISGALISAGDRGTIVLREGAPPMMGGEAIAKFFLSSRTGRAACDALKDRLSRSGDLGYTYGTYSIASPSNETGYYLRVWRLRGGGWKLAVDLTIPGS